MMPEFEFEGYELVKAEPHHKKMCQQWIDLDDDHRNRVTPDFFLKQEPGIESLLLVNKATGEPELFLRITRALRVDIQFKPAFSDTEKLATANAMRTGFSWLRERAQASGLRQIIFASTVKPLVYFCTRRFGFRQSADELVSDIPAPKVEQAQG